MHDSANKLDLYKQKYYQAPKGTDKKGLINAIELHIYILMI